MKKPLKTLTLVPAILFFLMAGAPWLNAQITDTIHARVGHSFVIGDETLPPGQYTFRMMEGSDLSVMNVSDENGKNIATFNVRRAVDDHSPKHSELVFRKYGNTEFLSKIFEVGSRNGVELTETSKQEAHLANEGQHATEHSEEQR